MITIYNQYMYEYVCVYIYIYIYIYIYRLHIYSHIYIHTLHSIERLVGQTNWDSSECLVPRKSFRVLL
jgi:hypothetical protein